MKIAAVYDCHLEDLVCLRPGLEGHFDTLFAHLGLQNAIDKTSLEGTTTNTRTRPTMDVFLKHALDLHGVHGKISVICKILGELKRR
jgi:hypothetical protein